MKKNILKVTLVAALALFAGYNVYSSQKSDVMSDLALANVEALASGEDGDRYHFWCCGNTDICAKGDNIDIHGKLSTTPYWKIRAYSLR